MAMNKIYCGISMVVLAVSACGPGGSSGTLPGTSSSSGQASSSSSSSGSSGGGMCPATAPIGESCQGNLHCEYGTETCCGETHPSIVCDCRDGSYACHYTDACFRPGCGSSSSGGTSSSSGGPICPPVLCDLACPFGFASDATGCPTCQCLPGACDSIQDPQACNNTAGCVGVFFDSATDPSVPPGRTDFQCCTQTPDGIFCGSEPPPPVGCYSDEQCGPGFVCDTVNYCNSACEPGAGACPDVCVGQCVPRNACWGAWLDQNGTCRAPNDGIYPQGCCTPEDRYCLSDVECGVGEYCNHQECLSPCRPGEACIEVCFGRCESGGPDVCALVDCIEGTECRACQPNEDCVAKCVPVVTDCRATGCGPNEECISISACPPVQCDCPPDALDCACPRCVEDFVCVPGTQDCRNTGCDGNLTCQPTMLCPDVGCVGDEPGAPCDLPVPPCETSWQCLPPALGCEAVLCAPGTVCQACGPNEDCNVRCVPLNTDCRQNGCGMGETCQPSVCATLVACECDPRTDFNCDCGCPDVWACVPDQTGEDCRLSGCAQGQTCEPVEYCTGVGCACPANDPSCECPPSRPPECFTAYQCTGADPCARLTETECALDFDLCTPIYFTACPPCADMTCDVLCQQSYAGCVSILEAQGGGGSRGP